MVTRSYVFCANSDVTDEVPFPSILNDKTLSTIFSESDILSGGSPTDFSAVDATKGVNMLDYVIDEEYSDDGNEGGLTQDETDVSTQLSSLCYDDEETTLHRTASSRNGRNNCKEDLHHRDFFGRLFDKMVCGTNSLCKTPAEVIREWRNPQKLEREMEELREDMALKPSLLHLRRLPPKQVKPPSSSLLKGPPATTDAQTLDQLSVSAPTPETVKTSSIYQSSTNKQQNGNRCELPTREEVNKEIRSKSFKDRERQLEAQRQYVAKFILSRKQQHSDEEDSDSLSVVTSASESEYSSRGTNYIDDSYSSTSSISSVSCRHRFFRRRHRQPTTPPRPRARGSPGRNRGNGDRRKQGNKLVITNLRGSPSRWNSPKRRGIVTTS